MSTSSAETAHWSVVSSTPYSCAKADWPGSIAPRAHYASAQIFPDQVVLGLQIFAYGGLAAQLRVSVSRLREAS